MQIGPTRGKWEDNQKFWRKLSYKGWQQTQLSAARLQHSLSERRTAEWAECENDKLEWNVISSM